jgi:DNA-binding NtrC family response regulator
MTVKQTHLKALVRLLNRVAEPVYVLDAELTIIFYNLEFVKWLGPITDKLLGTKCTYHTPAEIVSIETVAAGLCPPPGISSGQIISSTVCYKGGEGRISQRRAGFFPFLSNQGDLLGVIAVVNAKDMDTEEGGNDLESSDDSQSDELHEVIRRFRQEVAGRFRADRLIGNSPAMQLARRQVELAANCQSSVLLVGPSGSGRQHLASAIHYANQMVGSVALPMGGIIPLDCSVLAEDLILSTIAALARSHSLEEKNRPTTLLLNHVDEISAEMQNALIIYLAKKPFPNRLLSTSRFSLVEQSGRGQFREDLAAFLSTITIVLPPLSQRREDLPLLAQVFLEECNERQAKQVGGFSPESLDQLYSYSWPGNLDELMEMVIYAHQHTSRPEIVVGDLPERLHLAGQVAVYQRRPEEKIVLDEYLGRVERELIRRALSRSKGNKAKAARLLGLTRPRLYRRMVQLGLEDNSKDDVSGASS